MVIKRLKEGIKSLSGNMNEDTIKKEIKEIEMINIELEHRVSKLIVENEHLKQTYKQIYESIKPTRTRSKELYDALVSQVNQKSVEISDLNVSLQEKDFVITTLKNELRKLKGNYLANNVVTKHLVAPEMLKVDVEPIAPKLLNNRTAHSYYLKLTQEQATILREVVEQGKSHNPLNNPLDFASSSSNLLSNKPMLSSTGPKPSTSASGSQPSGNTKNDKIQQMLSSTQKNKVKAHPRKVKSSLKNKNCFVEPQGNANVQHSKLNVNSELLCVKCNGFMLSDNHDLCVLDFINDVNAHAKSKSVKKISKRKGRLNFTEYLDSGCSKHMTRDRSQLTDLVNKFLGTVKFGNDHVAKILGYGDYQIRNVTILRVYCVERLGHTLFYVGKFYDLNLEVSFCQHTCFIRNLEGVDLLTGSRGNNLYTMSLRDMMASSPICLLSKASKTKSCLWHRRLSHLNFGTINHLARHGLVRGLLKLKFKKHHLCSACAMVKSKKKPHKRKSEDTNQEKLYLLHMDLCGPMRVTSVNGKKYILIIVDDYSRFIWVKCLRLKDEALDFIIKFLKMIQVEHSSTTTLAMLHLRISPTKDSILNYQTDVLRRIIIETIHVDFDELTAMASKHSSLEPALHEMTPVIISSGLVPNPPPSTSFVPPSRIQEEPNMNLNVFKSWKLVPTRTDKVMVITIKMDLQKVKLEELGGILKNKSSCWLSRVTSSEERSLKKYGMESSDPVDTPMVEKSKLDEDPQDADHAGCQDTRQSTSGSDIFTKALGRERIEFLINKLGMRSFTPKTLKQLADEVEE
ncbi:retrovirus-related pol polyprotein from transposon TNT 1-94 [Tanacetum coccineum]